LYIVALKGTPLSVNDYETVFSISSTTRALKNCCVYVRFFQCCVVLHIHTTLLSHAWLHPLFYQWLCVGPSQPGIDEWFSVWKQSPADLRSQSHCSFDKLETWLLLENNTDSTEYEHFVVMYLFLRKRKMWLPCKKVCCNDDNWWTWGMEFFGDASTSIMSIKSTQAIIHSKSKYIIIFSHFRNQGSPVKICTDMPFSTPCFHLTSFLLWHRKFCS